MMWQLNTSELESLRTDLTSIVQQLIVQDTCEITIAGFPEAINLSMRDAAAKVFSANGLPDAINFVIEIRECPPIKEAASGSVLSSKSAFRELAIKLVSQHFRDSVLRNASLLDKQNIKTIFGCDGDGTMYINCLYPMSVYL